MLQLSKCAEVLKVSIKQVKTEDTAPKLAKSMLSCKRFQDDLEGFTRDLQEDIEANPIGIVSYLDGE